jgi:hypothetical protein
MFYIKAIHVLKITVFRDVTACSLVDVTTVWEEPTASETLFNKQNKGNKKAKK